MTLVVDSVTDADNDLLTVVGHDADEQPPTDAPGDWSPTPLEASGWVSATTNYYPPSCYDANGNLVKGSKPRAMTPAEVGDYALSLLLRVDTSAPTPIHFTA